jgi:transposase
MSKITYLGLDVHSRSIEIPELGPGATSPKHTEIPNDRKVVRRTFTRLKAQHAELRCCYEAGVCGFELYRQLTEMGIACEVIAPALIPRKPGDRIKTDRRDADKLARLYRAGELTPIHVPGADEEGVRDLVRAREDVRKDLVAARHRLDKFLIRHGHIYTAGSKWTEKYWDWVKQISFDRAPEHKTFEHYRLGVEYIQDRREALDREIGEIAAAPAYADRVGRLTCFRGISVLSAMVLLTEIQDFRRFEHPRALMAFLGLVPCEHSSGTTERRGGITKTGNSHARRILVEGAWHYRHRPALGTRIKKALTGQPPEMERLARRSQDRLHRRYCKLVGRGKSGPTAIVAVARELSGFVWSAMVL